MYKDDIWSKYISFYPYTDEVKNLRLSGLKYELEGVDVIKGSSRTVSNEFAEGIDKAYVSLYSRKTNDMKVWAKVGCAYLPTIV